MQERTKTTKNELRILNRKQALGLMGTAGVAVATWGCGTGTSTSTEGTSAEGTAANLTTASEATSTAAIPSCILSPEVTEGPYYLEGDIVRANIVEDREGIPLRLRVTVADSVECVALENAAVDIWHCDAKGAYSGFTEASEQDNGGGMPEGEMSGEPPSGEMPSGEMPDGPPPEDGGAGGGMSAEPTDDLTFLRGVQLTDESGVAEFETVYPGWYAGRALHIHLKVMVGGTVDGETYEGGHVAHTGQIFFPEEITEKIEAFSPYSETTTTRVLNEDDNIFQQAGDGATATLTPITEGSVQDGYVAELVVGIEPDEDTSPDAA